MARLIVSYTINEIIEVHVEDYLLTDKEIQDLASKAASKAIPLGAICEDFEWERPFPKSKNWQRIAPDDCWLEVEQGLIASNNWVLVLKDFSLPDSLQIDNPWQNLNKLCDHHLEKLQETIEEASLATCLHQGWFRPSFLPFKEILGLEVRGKPDRVGGIFVNGKFKGALMPMVKHRAEDCAFQFHPNGK
jgi:hypothetical protein